MTNPLRNPGRFMVNPRRRTAFVAGVLFIITFVTAAPAQLVLYSPVLDDANYIVGAGSDGRPWSALRGSPCC